PTPPLFPYTTLFRSRRQVAVRQVPRGLPGDIGLAVPLPAAGGVASAAVALHEARGGRGGVIRPLVPVLIPDSGAVQAGIAVSAAVARLEEPPADAGDVGVHQRRDVGIGLRRIVVA